MKLLILQPLSEHIDNCALFQDMAEKKFPLCDHHMHTALNTKISLNFLVWKFCGKVWFPQSFDWFAENSVGTVLTQNFNTRILDETAIHAFLIRNRFIRNSSQIGLLTQETNLASLIFLRNSKKVLCTL